MSLLNKASLIQIPSGYKDGTLYSAKPTNGDGDFTFSRGSNLAATRVNSNGLIEKGRENRLLQSNNFDTWPYGPAFATVTSGFEGYDGSNDAWKITSTLIGGETRVRQSQTFTTGEVISLSVYMKKGNVNFGIVRTYAITGGGRAWFDLENGTVATENSGINGSIEDVGNGWYRCSIWGVITTTGAVDIAPAPADGDYLADAVGEFIYIQDSQLESGLVATDYIETGASTAQAGILEDMPRLDYSGGATCPSLLLEPQRTNEVQYSEYFEASNWSIYSYGGASLARDFGYSSPEGKNNAYRLSYTAGSGSNGILLTDNFTATASVDYTLSVWMKGAVGGEKVRLCLMDTGSNGVIGSTFTLTNEWVLYTDTITNSAGTNRGFQFRIQDVIGVNDDQVVYVYGAQAEQGSYATSYIPTYGYGASVTRGADTLTALNITSIVTGISFTWFLNLNEWQGSDTNVGDLVLSNLSGGQIQLRVRTDGYRFFYLSINAGTLYPIAASQTARKFCIKYDGSNFKLFRDGVLEATTASVGDTDWSGLSQSAGGSTLPLDQLLIFNSALSDDECIQLTT